MRTVAETCSLITKMEDLEGFSWFSNDNGR